MHLSDAKSLEPCFTFERDRLKIKSQNDLKIPTENMRKSILSMSHQSLNILSKIIKTFTGWPLSNAAVSFFTGCVSNASFFFQAMAL